MIQPTRGRILVKMIPATDGLPNKLNLKLVDKHKHFDHVSRRGVVEAFGKDVDGISVGDIVVFRGDAGYTLDGDAELGAREGYGEENWRWLKSHELLAVEEPLPETKAFHEKVFEEAQHASV